MIAKRIILISFVNIFLFQPAVWAEAETRLNSDSDYSIKIAVTINQDDQIMGFAEYSNHAPQFPLQLVTFNPIGGVIHAEPYGFELIEKKIIRPNVHRVKLRPLNDRYGATVVSGTIDFSDELHPKIYLANATGGTYVSNITKKGKKYHQKYIPNVWLGE